MIEIGTRYQASAMVTAADTAEALGSGALAVLATPRMAALMENAAMSCIRPFLEEGRGSVGIRLDIRHDAPTPVGMTFFAEAEVTAVSAGGKIVDFQVRAWDERGPIGQGTHTRAVIDEKRFLEKCNAKLSPAE